MHQNATNVFSKVIDMSCLKIQAKRACTNFQTIFNIISIDYECSRQIKSSKYKLYQLLIDDFATKQLSQQYD